MEGYADTLKTIKYYHDHASMFLKESYGLTDRLDALVKILNLIDTTYDELINRVNIFNTDVKTDDLFLDLIGSIYSCPRAMSLKVLKKKDKSIKPDPINLEEEGYTVEKAYIKLSNDEYRAYLITQIIKQHFGGTAEEIDALYGDNGTLSTYGYNNISFTYSVVNDDSPLQITIYWSNEADHTGTNANTNLRYLFLNNYLTIESMGIMYTKSILNVNSIGYFNSSWFWGWGKIVDDGVDIPTVLCGTEIPESSTTEETNCLFIVMTFDEKEEKWSYELYKSNGSSWIEQSSLSTGENDPTSFITTDFYINTKNQTWFEKIDSVWTNTRKFSNTLWG